MAAIPAEPADVKSCCAEAYSRDVVALVLGPSFHPGGLALTRHLADALNVRPGQRVLDIASGPGTTALLLAAEYGVRVVGVDYSADLTAKACDSGHDAGLTGRVGFLVGDAEQLPFPDASFDAVVCECAFCTFPVKTAAAAEFARVLRPGGRLGITDVTVRPDALPPQLRDLTGVIACLADARPLQDYVRLLADAGLGTIRAEDQRQALTDMVDRIEARLRVLAMTRPAHVSRTGIDVDRAVALTGIAAAAIRDGAAGYALITASRASSPPGRGW